MRFARVLDIHSAPIGGERLTLRILSRATAGTFALLIAGVVAWSWRNEPAAVSGIGGLLLAGLSAVFACRLVEPFRHLAMSAAMLTMTLLLATNAPAALSDASIACMLILMTCGSIYAFSWRAQRRWLIPAGVLIGTASLLHPANILVGLAIAVVLLRSRRRSKRTRRWLIAMASIAVAIPAASVAMGLHGELAVPDWHRIGSPEQVRILAVGWPVLMAILLHRRAPQPSTELLEQVHTSLDDYWVPIDPSARLRRIALQLAGVLTVAGLIVSAAWPGSQASAMAIAGAALLTVLIMVPTGRNLLLASVVPLALAVLDRLV